MENQTKKTEEASWNLSQHLINEIAGLLKSASYLISGNDTREDALLRIQGCFKSLRAIRFRMVSYLTTEEVKSFRSKEDNFDKLIIPPCVNTGFGSKEYDKWELKSLKELPKEIDQYNQSIMNALKKYGLLIPPKEDRTKMKV